MRRLPTFRLAVALFFAYSLASAAETGIPDMFTPDGGCLKAEEKKAFVVFQKKAEVLPDDKEKPSPVLSNAEIQKSLQSLEKDEWLGTVAIAASLAPRETDPPGMTATARARIRVVEDAAFIKNYECEGLSDNRSESMSCRRKANSLKRRLLAAYKRQFIKRAGGKDLMKTVAEVCKEGYQPCEAAVDMAFVETVKSLR